ACQRKVEAELKKFASSATGREGPAKKPRRAVALHLKRFRKLKGALKKIARRESTLGAVVDQLLRMSEPRDFDEAQTREDLALATPTRRIEECLSCGGTGLLRSAVEDAGRTYEVARPCALRQLQARLQLFNAIGLPAVHATSSFDTFKPAFEKAGEAKRRAVE